MATFDTVSIRLNDLLAERRLLEHPFYQRWSAGTLGRDELVAYAGQYRAIEAQLPVTLGEIHAALEEGVAKNYVAQNLADELGNPASHLDLFDRFSAALGAEATTPQPAMATLVDTYATASSKSSAYALGVLAAYEVQGSAIADTKGEGLRSWYDMSASDTTFWDAHVELEADHAAWTVEALASLSDAELEEAFAGAEASATAWWGFLDEREAANSATCLA